MAAYERGGIIQKMDFYFSVASIGKYIFNFRPDSDEEQEEYENQNTSKIGKGRTANIVRMNEDGTSYEQLTREGFFECEHENIVNDINRRLAQGRLRAKIVLGVLVLLALPFVYNVLKAEGIVDIAETIFADFALHIWIALCAAYILLVFFLILKNKRRKKIHLLYDISPEREEGIQKFYDGCFKLAESERVWIVNTEKRHSDTRRHAGARASVSRTSVAVYNEYVPKIQTNINLPTIYTGINQVSFFPDKIFYIHDKWLRVVSYEDLEITLSGSRFRETEYIPSDAERLGHTWKYVNNDGSPDKRFNNNRRIPVLRYCDIKIESTSGFCLTLMTSNFEIGKAFARALNWYKAHYKDDSQ